MIKINSIFTGEPRTITDERGTWRSAIFRAPVDGEVRVTVRGLEGDRVADTKNHGTPDQALCCHPLGHYAFWNEFYGLSGEDAVGPGGVGENWTLFGDDESGICVGDVYAAGTSRVQVSGPRVPCWKQERKLGLPGFHRRTLESLRTGFYMRVLEEGTVRTGDELRIEDRPNPGITQRLVNECAHGSFDPALARRLLEVPELADGWKKILRSRLSG
ncbi:MAG TPA: MOSC domain-containing protein [Rubrobacteraceae bacterium]|nr:MOSC domain-containing protein [Rubrobacteraceae bacterium]